MDVVFRDILSLKRRHASSGLDVKSEREMSAFPKRLSCWGLTRWLWENHWYHGMVHLPVRLGKQLAFCPVSLQGNSKQFLLSVLINSLISWRGSKSTTNCQNFWGILERKLALQGINAKSQTVSMKSRVQTSKVMNSCLWLWITRLSVS